MDTHQTDEVCDDNKCEIKNYPKAPKLQISKWLNTADLISIADLKGSVVVIEAFQMLCPGCVNHSLPQAKRLHAMFKDEKDIRILGLHSVFEHHEAMTEQALKAFLSEFHYDFPVGIDKPAESGPVPKTMKSYGLRGTPSLIIIDKNGNLRKILFGVIDDIALGIKIGKLLQE